jgi:SHS2 domain-containing protein
MLSPGYTILEHPSDLGIEARGETLPEVFRQAAVGLMSVIVDPSTVYPRESRPVELTASDVEQLLVRWLAEILYLFDGQRFVCKEFSVRDVSPTILSATVLGEAFASSRHRTRVDVKAVTYHQLAVREDREGAMARVFLDI